MELRSPAIKFLSVFVCTGVHTAEEMGLQNIALHMEAKALNETANATIAVDGNSDPYYQSKSCTHSELIADPWWMVDLGVSTRFAE